MFAPGPHIVNPALGITILIGQFGIIFSVQFAQLLQFAGQLVDGYSIDSIVSVRARRGRGEFPLLASGVDTLKPVALFYET